MVFWRTFWGPPRINNKMSPRITKMVSITHENGENGTGNHQKHEKNRENGGLG